VRNYLYKKLKLNPLSCFTAANLALIKSPALCAAQKKGYDVPFS
jgi:hypothetical protein